ncbi:MAG: anti-sigma factor domain-containing protein [Pseudonocardiaceae bacterium]
MNDQRQSADCPHRELAVGWALHALEPAEESLVASHLPDCPLCKGTAAQTEDIGATLGLSVPEVIPSARLEQRILSVTGDRWVPPVVPEPAPVTPLTRPERRTIKSSVLRSGGLAAAAAVILVAAAAVLGVRVVQLNGELDQAQSQVSAMSGAMQNAADPATTRVPLVTKGGQAVGMVLASQNHVAVLPTRLASNRVTDQTYVLWGLAGGSPIALTAFDVSGDAPGLHIAQPTVAQGTFTGYAVSLEPGRHVPAVPTDVVASGQVPS